ncbi:MAG: ABC transporter permease [Candidatus Methanomethylophilaceae archaeon]|jgi:ABC-2 type transport system permease protein
MSGPLTIVASAAKMDFRSKFAVVGPLMRLAVIMLTNLFSMYFFFLLASYIGKSDVTPDYVIIGNMIQSIATSTLYSTSNISNMEKHTGTLEPLLTAPSRMFYTFFGKSIFGILNGIVSVTVSISFAAFVFGVDFSSANLSVIAVIGLLTCLSLTGMGMAVGSVGLYLRTSSIIASLFSYIGLLVCGVNFPVSYLPGWLQIFSYAMPLTYAVDATRMAVGGATLSAVSQPLMIMIVLGLVYLIISWFIFNLFEKISRKTGKIGSF